jgi:hypothetical protein
MLKIKSNQRKILNQSFVHQLLFRATDNIPFVYSRNENFNTQWNNRVWRDLPKKVWIYSKNSSDDLISKFMMIINEKENALAGLDVRFVNSRSFESLLPGSIVKQVEEVLKRSHYSWDTELK